MALINYQIPNQGFELISVRIGEILFEELKNQFDNYGGDTALNPTIFQNRVVNFNHAELPCLNIKYSNGTYDNHNNKTNDGTYSYYIDAYFKAPTTDDGRGDTKSYADVLRLLGVCRTILENNNYNLLGFDPGLIIHTAVSSITMDEPQDNQDTAHTSMGRLVFTVKACEQTVFNSANVLQGYQTSVKLHETDEGYVFSDVDLI